MLGQPLSMLIPQVIGVRLSGQLPEGATATDLVLTIAELLRSVGVVGTFVEFFGPGVAAVPVANRATIGNMSPEYGCTSAIFPIDEVTLDYLRLTGRPERAGGAGRGVRQGAGAVARPGSRAGLLPGPGPGPGRGGPVDRRAETAAGPDPAGPGAAGVPRGAGPVRPGPGRTRPGWTRPARSRSPPPTRSRSPATGTATSRPASPRPPARRGGRASPVKATLDGGQSVELDHGAVVIAAITSCTNTSNPEVMIAAALLAKKAAAARPGPETVGEDLAGPRLPGGHGLLRPGRADPLAGQARLQPGRLRLHHLHRQLRPADPRGLRRDRRGRPGGLLGAVRQPQLRGPHPPRDQAELPGLPAAGGRLRAGRHHGHRPDHRPAGHRQRRAAGLPARHLAVAGRDRRGHRLLPAPGDVHPRVRRGVRRGRAVAVPAGPGRRHVRLGPGLHLRAPAAVLRRAGRRSPARWPTSRAPGCSPCSATRSPPTTSPRPGRSRPTPRQAGT